ncbi:MAG: DUF6172 family protein [Campylobacterota bacterium]|nr:DUF6172 family protein [Campylobacterota bacterium]
MKKRFALTASNKAPARVLESIKNEIRKYIKREKRKPLSDGADFWRLDCKFAQNDDEPKEIKYEDITKCINEASEQNCESIYIELISKAVKKAPKETQSA